MPTARRKTSTPNHRQEVSVNAIIVEFLDTQVFLLTKRLTLS